MSMDGWAWVSRGGDSSQFDGADERAVREWTRIYKDGEQCKNVLYHIHVNFKILQQLKNRNNQEHQGTLRQPSQNKNYFQVFLLSLYFKVNLSKKYNIKQNENLLNMEKDCRRDSKWSLQMSESMAGLEFHVMEIVHSQFSDSSFRVSHHLGI